MSADYTPYGSGYLQRLYSGVMDASCGRMPDGCDFEDDENYLDDEAEDAARRERERDEARSAYYDSLW